MDRKKFVTIFSTSLIGAALLKANPLNLFSSKKNYDPVKVKPNPDAVQREKAGRKNG
jgi:hypothetical protein